MRLPFTPPLAPMLSTAANALPGGDGWQFEPKWDGFRTLVFRDGDEVLLQSRDEKPMNRYFPELIAPLAAGLPERCVVDGETVIVGADRLDFAALLTAAAAFHRRVIGEAASEVGPAPGGARRQAGSAHQRRPLRRFGSAVQRGAGRFAPHARRSAGAGAGARAGDQRAAARRAGARRSAEPAVTI